MTFNRNDRRTIRWMIEWEDEIGEPPSLDALCNYRLWNSISSAKNFVRRMQREGVLDENRRTIREYLNPAGEPRA